MKVFGIFFRLALIATAFTALVLPLCSAHAAPQQGPAVANNLAGTWINVDPKTRGLVEIDIHELKIHPFGACHPNPCDWGVLKAKPYAASVDSSFAAALLARCTTSFSRSEITLTLETDGRLRAEVFTHFTDQSGRVDYRFVKFFNRIRPPYVPPSSTH